MATHTLLVADHSQTVQRIIEMACVGEDVDVVMVGDGEMAIERIAERPPDIVLADTTMPRRNGYEVAAFVKGRADLAHIPVLLLAGMFEAADEARATALGCAEVLVKPLKPHHVMGRVRHWLEFAPGRLLVEPGAAVPHAEAPGERGDSTIPASALSAEDYFSRLDAAFKSLERPLGTRVVDSAGGPVGAESGGLGEPVPTLQELLDRLPVQTRTILTPAASAEVKESTPALSDAKESNHRDARDIDAIATRVIDRLSSRGDLLDEIARRVALRQNPAGR